MALDVSRRQWGLGLGQGLGLGLGLGLDLGPGLGQGVGQGLGTRLLVQLLAGYFATIPVPVAARRDGTAFRASPAC